MRPPEKLEASVRDCRMHLDISPGGDMELQKTPGRAWLRYIVAITLVTTGIFFIILNIRKINIIFYFCLRA